MGHFLITAGSQIAGIRDGFQIRGFIDAQFPQSGGKTNFPDEVSQCLHTGTSQFPFRLALR